MLQRACRTSGEVSANSWHSVLTSHTSPRHLRGGVRPIRVDLNFISGLESSACPAPATAQRMREGCATASDSALNSSRSRLMRNAAAVGDFHLRPPAEGPLHLHKLRTSRFSGSFASYRVYQRAFGCQQNGIAMAPLNCCFITALRSTASRNGPAGYRIRRGRSFDTYTCHNSSENRKMALAAR